jgi:hypothetical protein
MWASAAARCSKGDLPTIVSRYIAQRGSAFIFARGPVAGLLIVLHADNPHAAIVKAASICSFNAFSR